MQESGCRVKEKRLGGKRRREWVVGTSRSHYFGCWLREADEIGEERYVPSPLLMVEF